MLLSVQPAKSQGAEPRAIALARFRATKRDQLAFLLFFFDFDFFAMMSSIGVHRSAEN